MTNSMMQFRADDEMKAKAIGICSKPGIDLQTYMRMCLSRLCAENGIPFSMKLPSENNRNVEEISAVRSARRQSMSCFVVFD